MPYFVVSVKIDPSCCIMSILDIEDISMLVGFIKTLISNPRMRTLVFCPLCLSSVSVGVRLNLLLSG
jgi:hypothetical protein